MSIENEIIALDVDDVIAGFYEAMCIKYMRPVEKVDIWDGEKDCKWIVEHFDEVRYDFEFWENLPVIADPSSINFDFHYYVSAFPEEMYEARKMWLEKNGFPDKPLICTTDKLATCKELGITVLVDDKKPTVEQLNAGGVLGVRFRPYYMIEDGQDIERLDQLPEFIKSKR
jgi:hypothetical protein